MTIAGAIDKINDKLAGTDKYAPVTIEGALNKLAETIPEGGWSGGGGYDLVIELNSNNPNIATAGTVKSGTFAACQTKALTNREPLNVLVYGVKPDPDYPYTTTFGILSAFFNNYSEEATVDIHVTSFYESNSYMMARPVRVNAANVVSFGAPAGLLIDPE